MIWTTTKPTKPGWYWVEYTNPKNETWQFAVLKYPGFGEMFTDGNCPYAFDSGHFLRWSDEPILMPQDQPHHQETP